MDSFIKIVPQKKDETLTSIHTKQIELVRRYIKECKNIFICGSSGVGKSYILREALQDTVHVELHAEHLKSKSYFLSFIKSSSKHVYIEEYDSVFKPIVQQVSDGTPLTHGSLIVVSTNMCMYPNFETIFVPKHKPEVLLKLCDRVTARGARAISAAHRCNGNIRNFFTYIDGYDEMDIFQTPKEFIAEVLCDSNPIEIRDSITEHGHVWDIFQENYLDSFGVDVVEASFSFSNADIVDSYIYKNGDWNLMPYFVMHALTFPKKCLGKPLNKNYIRPGSCWTKLGNYKMRKHKATHISNKSVSGLGVEELCLLKKYAENGIIEPLLSYNITPQDFDVINHLAVGNSLKSKDVTRIKKLLKNAYERR
ncbi:hypothetical protein FK873_gp232 [Micromonas pusilla virus SP1]|jgi:hypothetical protein|uniref:Uncharacterized protein n=1 Tax=Micromonas pusilla virus SP1 TaxID=373996 RepID=G9E679_MPSP1|nr:hypothetical protein FK873_gp232 [Micromonas pusilla virus SP1]AET84906.1 hypothetical protein MPXG_00108 [Micromonas pusilla virus SP1]